MITYAKILLLNFLLVAPVLGQSTELIEAYNKINEFKERRDYETAGNGQKKL